MVSPVSLYRFESIVADVLTDYLALQLTSDAAQQSAPATETYHETQETNDPSQV